VGRPKIYVDLIVWQKAMVLAGKIYKVSEELPKNETLGLMSQVRCASVSV
jgi:four helix bundle protein